MIGNGLSHEPPIYYDHFEIPNFKVSWAGPASAFLAYGSEDGGLRFFIDGNGQIDGFEKVSPSGEAINGLAWLGRWLAVSTRRDIFLFRDQFKFIPGGAPRTALLPIGAHGVISTPGGYFMAPMGQRGLMAVKPTDSDQDNVFLLNDNETDIYFYRSIALRHTSDADVIVSAARRSGIIAGILPHDLTTHIATTISPNNVDVVDVCSLGDGLAVAALGRDGTLILFRDIINDKTPYNFKFKRFAGTGYRLLYSRGHIFVLTTKALYMVADIAKRVKSGEPQDDRETQILTMPMNAIDANLYEDKYVLVVNEQSNVFRVYIDNVVRDIPQHTHAHEPPQVEKIYNEPAAWTDSQDDPGRVAIPIDRRSGKLNRERVAVA
jgi:hypothetical protein